MLSMAYCCVLWPESVISVSCKEGSIRLLVGDNNDYYLDNAREDETKFIEDALSQGRVEICINGTYGTICADDDSWSNLEAAVVCKELGFTENGMFYSKWLSRNLLNSQDTFGAPTSLHMFNYKKHSLIWFW